MAYNRSSSNFNQAETAILTTILYSDIFHFPLTKDELWRFLITSKPISKNAFAKGLSSLRTMLLEVDGYWSLKKRSAIIAKRRSNLEEVERKMSLAKTVAAKLAIIPSIHFIGISGGLAAGKADKADDIDLFIIVKENTLFVSRFWVSVLLERMGVRRKRGEQHAADKICVNLLIDTSALEWPKDRRDIYTAREVAQLQPLFDRSNTYGAFLKQNRWVQDFLPNAFEEKRQPASTVQVSSRVQHFIFLIATMSLFEPVMRFAQNAYMSRHKTTEMVTKHNIAFHPKDYRAETLSQLKLKLQHLGLLTNI